MLLLVPLVDYKHVLDIDEDDDVGTSARSTRTNCILDNELVSASGQPSVRKENIRYEYERYILRVK